MKLRIQKRLGKPKPTKLVIFLFIFGVVLGMVWLILLFLVASQSTVAHKGYAKAKQLGPWTQENQNSGKLALGAVPSSHQHQKQQSQDQISAQMEKMNNKAVEEANSLLQAMQPMHMQPMQPMQPMQFGKKPCLSPLDPNCQQQIVYKDELPILYYTYETALLQQKLISSKLDYNGKNLHSDSYRLYMKNYNKTIGKIRNQYQNPFAIDNTDNNRLISFNIYKDLPILIEKNENALHSNSILKFVLLRVTSNNVTILTQNPKIYSNVSQASTAKKKNKDGVEIKIIHEKTSKNMNKKLPFVYFLNDNHCSDTVFELKSLFEPSLSKLMQKLKHVEKKDDAGKFSALIAINCFSCANDINNERTNWLSYLSAQSQMLSYCMTLDYLLNYEKYHSILIPRFYSDPKSYFIEKFNDSHSHLIVDPPIKSEILAVSKVNITQKQLHYVLRWLEAHKQFTKQNSKFVKENKKLSFSGQFWNFIKYYILRTEKTPQMILDDQKRNILNQIRQDANKNEKLASKEIDLITNLKYPWEKRANIAVFHGRLTHPWRYQLWKLFLDCNELFGLSKNYMRVVITSAYHFEHPYLQNSILTHQNNLQLFDVLATSYNLPFTNAKEWYQWQQAELERLRLPKKDSATTKKLSQHEMELKYMKVVREDGHEKDMNNRHFTSFMKFDAQISKFKYVIHVEGWSCAARLAKYLTAGFVVIWLQDNVYFPEKQNVEHWYESLVPYKHYIPVQWGSTSMDDNITLYEIKKAAGEQERENENILKEMAQNNEKIWIQEKLTNLLDAIVFLQNNDDFAKQIAINAQEFMKNEFTKKGINDYLWNNVFDKIEVVNNGASSDGVRQFLEEYDTDDEWQVLPLDLLSLKVKETHFIT